MDKNGLKLKGNIFLGRCFIPGSVEFDDRFKEIKLEETLEDSEDCYIIPGLIDVHTHGAMGEDFSDAEADIDKILEFYASRGVTSVLATTMTMPKEKLCEAVKHIRSFSGTHHGAKIAGIHLEGPFISRKKIGAQDIESVSKPNVDEVLRINKMSGGLVRLVTYAPEEEEDDSFTNELSKIMKLSAGHTMCDYETAKKAFEAGADHLTHMFNAMPELCHRAKGLIDAAMESGAYAELITDGIHVTDAMIKSAFALFGDKLCLITDSLPCAGMPEGTYKLGGEDIMLGTDADSANTVARRPDGTLAGSTIGLIDGVRHCVEIGIPLEEAVYAATTAPADSINLSGVGRIAEGNHADIVVLDKELQIKAVYIDGRKVI